MVKRPELGFIKLKKTEKEIVFGTAKIQLKISNGLERVDRFDQKVVGTCSVSRFHVKESCEVFLG